MEICVVFNIRPGVKGYEHGRGRVPLNLGPPYFPERNGPERNVPDRKHHLIPRNGPRVKVQLGLSP